MIEDVSNACAAVLEQDCQNNALLKALNAQLADVEKSSRNLIKAIEAGVFTASMRERLAELEQQKEDITVQIAREQLRKPQLSAEQIAFFLRSFLDGDAHDPNFQERIIESLVRRVDVYDEGPGNRKLTVFYNLKKNNHSSVSVKCSDSESVGLPKRLAAEAADFFLCFLQKDENRTAVNTVPFGTVEPS